MAYLVVDLTDGSSRIEKKLSDDALEDLINKEGLVFDVGDQIVARLNEMGIPFPVEES